MTRTSLLTSRQVRLLQLAVTGLPDKLIAVELGVHPDTVRYHWRCIYDRLQVANRGDALLAASWLGLIEPACPECRGWMARVRALEGTVRQLRAQAEWDAPPRELADVLADIEIEEIAGAFP